MKASLLPLLLLVQLFQTVTPAQNTVYSIAPVAGKDQPIGDGGPASASQLNQPTGIVADRSGAVYFSDMENFRIRKIDPRGTVSTVAGNGSFGYTGDGGPATNAALGRSGGLALDPRGNLYFTDTFYHVVRKVDLNGRISTVAGTGKAGFSGDSGPAVSAALNTPYAVASDGAGNLYIADTYNHRIRKVDTTGQITTIAGTGRDLLYVSNGTALNSPTSSPEGLAFDAAGNLYYSSYETATVIKIDNATGRYTVYAGSGYFGADGGDGGPATSGQMLGPVGIVFDSTGNLYIAEADGQCIRHVSPGGILTTAAGNGKLGFAGDGGPAGLSQVFSPFGVAIDAQGKLLFTDQFNNRVRAIDPASLTIASVAGSPAALGDNGPAASAQFVSPTSMAYDAAGNLYIADTYNHRIRKVAPGGTVSTFAGSGAPGFSGDSGPAVSAQFLYPQGVAADAFGNIVVADTGNRRIRKINPAGNIQTIAGNSTLSLFGGDGGPATSASLSAPACVRYDAKGNLFFADTLNGRIRKIGLDGSIVTVAGGGQGPLGDGGIATSATFALPSCVSIDAAGNLFIADTFNGLIRKVDTSGIVTTVAGNGKYDFTGDGGPATAAALFLPEDAVPDNAGNLFIADTFNSRIRVVSSKGVISTVAGTGFFGNTGDGGAALNAQIGGPASLLPDGKGSILFTDQLNNRVRKLTPQAAPAPTPDFTFVADAASKTVASGSAVTFLLTVAPQNNFTGSVTLSFRGGVAFSQAGTIAFSPESPIAVAGQPVTVKAIFTAPLTTDSFSQLFSIVADAGSLEHAVTLTAAITAVAPSGPVISAAGVANAASFGAGAIAPGEIVTIYGTGMGPATLAALQLDDGGKVASTLAGTKVTFNGVPAPIVYTSAGQISAIVPYEVAGSSSANLQVSYQGVASNTVPLAVTDAAPALFTYNSSGTGLAASTNQDGSVNTADNPAARESIIVLYGTGEGQTDPGGLTGQLASSPLPKPLQNVTVTIGGQPATVAYAGAAPGEVAGLIQINAVIPASVTPGPAVPVVFTVGSKTSQTGVAIAVK